MSDKNLHPVMQAALEPFMPKVEHTPGPWSVVPYGDGDSLVIHSDSNSRVCFMATPGSFSRDFPKIEANARLIAAAPDLLEALLVIFDGVEDEGGPEDSAVMLPLTCGEIAKARAAIAKATGQ